MSSCTKEGPAGATGAPGAQGPAGEDGINGTDGTAGCVACHDGGTSQGMFAQTIQWEKSVHATGGNFNRNNSCGECHTSQGFRATLAGTFDGLVENPNPINCYTCHNIHETYTSADLGFSTTTAVTTIVGGEVFDMGKGNLCATCHQARSISPLPVIGGADVTLGSYRYGGHHGPQANVVIGSGLFEFSGSEGYGTNQQHGGITDGCVTCHMSEAVGDRTGGHTMTIREEGSSSVAISGCTECHGSTSTDATNLQNKVKALQLEVGELLEELKDLLIAQGMMDDGSHGHAGYAITGSQPANLAAAFVNWQLIEEDRSLGVHNPIYVVALLKNTIAAID